MLSSEDRLDASVRGRQAEFLKGFRERGTIAAGIRAAVDSQGKELVTREEVRRWRAHDAAFRRAFEEAKAVFLDGLEEEVLAFISRGKWEALKFKLAAEMPEKYGVRKGGEERDEADARWRELQEAVREEKRREGRGTEGADRPEGRDGPEGSREA